MANLLPDVHRELLRVHETGNLVVAELLIQGTFLGPLPTPAGPLAPTGAKVNIPTADFFYLRAGKIETFNCYVSMNIMLAQMGDIPRLRLRREDVGRHLLTVFALRGDHDQARSLRTRSASRH